VLQFQEALERGDRGWAVAGVAQAKAEAKVRFAFGRSQGGIPSVGGDGLGAVAGAPRGQRQSVPASREVGPRRRDRPQLVDRFAVALLPQ
jgi:hypothetical protein